MRKILTYLVFAWSWLVVAQTVDAADFYGRIFVIDARAVRAEAPNFDTIIDTISKIGPASKTAVVIIQPGSLRRPIYLDAAGEFDLQLDGVRARLAQGNPFPASPNVYRIRQALRRVIQSWNGFNVPNSTKSVHIVWFGHEWRIVGGHDKNAEKNYYPDSCIATKAGATAKILAPLSVEIRPTTGAPEPSPHAIRALIYDLSLDIERASFMGVVGPYCDAPAQPVAMPKLDPKSVGRCEEPIVPEPPAGAPVQACLPPAPLVKPLALSQSVFFVPSGAGGANLVSLNVKRGSNLTQASLILEANGQERAIQHLGTIDPVAALGAVPGTRVKLMAELSPGVACAPGATAELSLDVDVAGAGLAGAGTYSGIISGFNCQRNNPVRVDLIELVVQ